MTETKIIVLDDDPTGSQTVHSCLLLTRWDTETLKQGLQDAAPLFFVLTNTRGMSAVDAANLTREVCINLRQALEHVQQSLQIKASCHLHARLVLNLQNHLNLKRK